MSDRERWTVYPLLFLTLGISVKDKIVKTVTADKVQCNVLVVSDRAGKDRIVLGTTPTGGILQMQGDKELRSILLRSSDTPGLVFVDARGNAHLPFLVPLAQRRTTGQGSAKDEQPNEPPPSEDEDQPDSPPGQP